MVETWNLSENYKVGVSVWLCVFGVIFPLTWGTRIEVVGPLTVTFWDGTEFFCFSPCVLCVVTGGVLIYSILKMKLLSNIRCFGTNHITQKKTWYKGSHDIRRRRRIWDRETHGLLVQLWPLHLPKDWCFTTESRTLDSPRLSRWLTSLRRFEIVYRYV